MTEAALPSIKPIDVPIEAIQHSRIGVGYVVLLISRDGAVDSCKMRLADGYIIKTRRFANPFSAYALNRQPIA